MKRSKGFRSKTRALLRKNPRDRGKIGLSRLLQEYEPGGRVKIMLEPSVHKGMPHRRFHGKIGVIKEKRGRSYVIEVSQGKSTKTVIARPEHLTPTS